MSRVPRPVAQGDFVYREPEPPIFVRSSGFTLVDQDGGSYIDAEAGNGAVALGYDYTILKNAGEELRNLPSLPSFCESALRLDVAERLNRRMEAATGCRGRIAFELGGAQGIELALKIARHNTGKQRYAVFEGGYHGRSALTSHLSASSRYRKDLPYLNVPVLRLPSPDCERCRFQRRPESCAVECATFVETSLASESAGLGGPDASDFCALVLEPVLNVGGMVYPDPRYLQRTVAEFRRHGALIVADEIFTGFYRTGRMFGFQHFDFVPDLLVTSKALTNGLVPLSCVWGRDPLLERDNFPPGTHSVTFGNNVLALSVAREVLGRFDAWTSIETDVAELERKLRTELTALAAKSALVASVDALGATARIRLCAPVAAELRQKVLTIAKDDPVDGYHGVLIASTGMTDDVVYLHPPLNLPSGVLETVAELLLRAARQVGAR